MYNNIDCDGDGYLDHACFNLYTGKRYLILSSEGCQNRWDWEKPRNVAECLPAWTDCITSETWRKYFENEAKNLSITDVKNIYQDIYNF